jgi:8-oxo-dGTP pyrophosphatase MutT (NUDIX family)
VDPLGEAGDWQPKTYALSGVVYAERDDRILLLRRAGGAMNGQWFLPGGAIENDELPEDGARRELREEAGLEIEGELELVGAYPMWVYGGDWLQLSYRGTVRDGDVLISGEHHEHQWVRPEDMAALLTDQFIEGLANGDDRILQLLGHIRTDLHRYLNRRASRSH